MNQVLIYQDYVHNNGSLFKALSSIFGRDAVAYADAADLANGCLSQDMKAFFMPGGASRYVAAKLDGRGNAAIKDYVTNGGIYVGICAGAYYACRNTVWQKGQPNEICVANELGFFPGDAIGPIASFVMGDNTAKTVKLDNGTKTFYWGGPLFHSNDNSFEVVARYADLPGQPAAAVTGRFGQGRYLLFSHHPEIDTEQLDLMTFDVVDNRYADIAALNEKTALTTSVFADTLRKFIV